MKNRIITISREFGSGGRSIGKAVAEALGIPCYDNELLKEIAVESGFNEKYVEDAGEYAPGGFLASAFSHQAPGPNNADYLWKIQYRLITELAEKGSCVIVGRCADYILRGRKDMLSVFIHAPMELRIQRISRVRNVEEDAARSLIKKTDRQRANYYNFYADNDWGAADSYDVAINSGKLGVEKSIEVLAGICEHL